MTGVGYILALSDSLGNSPCAEAVQWVRSLRPKRPSVRRIWDSCERSDWLIWWLDAVDGWDDSMRRLFACYCAERRLLLHKDRDPRSVRAVQVAYRYALGQSTSGELAAASVEACVAADEAMYAAWVATRSNAQIAARDAVWITPPSAACDWIRAHVRCPQ